MRIARSLAAALTLASTGSTVALGQSIALSTVTVDADHQLLGDPLVGAAANVRVPRGDGRFVFRFGAMMATGRAERIGSPCGSLPPPGCFSQNVRDDGRLMSAYGGASLRIVGGQRAELAVTGDLMVGTVRARTRGLTSGGSLLATKHVIGPLLGLETSWRLVPRLPIALEIAGAVGSVGPITTEEISDGYLPFDTSFGVLQLRAGVAWHGFSRASR